MKSRILKIKGRLFIEAEWEGEVQCLSLRQWAEKIGLKYITLKGRYDCGRGPDEIIGKIPLSKNNNIVRAAKADRSRSDRVSKPANMFLLGGNHEAVIRSIGATRGRYRE